MMLNLYVQQNQWIVVALMAGVALMLLFYLTYQALWRPREEESKGEGVKVTGIRSFIRWILSFFPLILILLIIISAVYTITHLLWAGANVPNW